MKFSNPPDEKRISSIKAINNFEVNDDQITFFVSGDINEFIKFISEFEVLELETESSNLSQTLLEYF